MQTECHKCGAPTGQGEPFCGRCGAVVGMRDSARRPEDASPSFAPTVVGKPPKAAHAAPKQAPRTPQIQTKTPTRPDSGTRDGGGARYFVAGFAAVLLVLLLLWLWTKAGG